MYQTEKTLQEHRDNLDAADVSAVETALNEGKEALKGDDVAAMERARDSITQASHKLAEAMYQQTAAAEPPGGNGGPHDSGSAETGSKDGEVVDAEFEDVN